MPKEIKYKKILGIGSLCLFLLGCSKESFLLQEADSSTMVLEETVVLEEEKAEEKVESEVLAKEAKPKAVEQLTEWAEIAVHVCGAVNRPGVYYLKENQRVYEGIQKAGGFREDADRDYLNQALFLEDGMKITVPTKEETAALEEEKTSDLIRKEDTATENRGRFIQKAEESREQPQFMEKAESAKREPDARENGKVDLNTADEALLCTLPGIGQSRAKSIIAYRKEHGFFGNTEDVMKVSGIKEAAYEKIKDYITVSAITPGD